jgi:hypothetical protein
MTILPILVLRLWNRSKKRSNPAFAAKCERVDEKVHAVNAPQLRFAVAQGIGFVCAIFVMGVVRMLGPQLPLSQHLNSSALFIGVYLLSSMALFFALNAHQKGN